MMNTSIQVENWNWLVKGRMLRIPSLGTCTNVGLDRQGKMPWTHACSRKFENVLSRTSLSTERHTLSKPIMLFRPISFDHLRSWLAWRRTNLWFAGLVLCLIVRVLWTVYRLRRRWMLKSQGVVHTSRSSISNWPCSCQHLGGFSLRWHSSTVTHRPISQVSHGLRVILCMVSGINPK